MSTASFAHSAQRSPHSTAIQALSSQTPGRIPWGESAPGHGKAPWTSARGGTGARAPFASRMEPGTSGLQVVSRLNGRWGLLAPHGGAAHRYGPVPALGMPV